LKNVENDFWNNRFKEYGRWKKTWYSDYLESGGFDTLTGFRIDGIMRKNAVINYPVQGSAFHCLLWSVIRVNKLLRKYRMRSRIAGQIHDSLIGDVRTEELKDYLDLVKQVMTEDIKKAYPWLIVPLDIENEICPENGSWYDKTVVNIENDCFLYETKDKVSRNCPSADVFLRRLAKDHLQSITPK
jgi:DNA polymerase I-like protein with 3'-5' exonuclease and polymerase domains